MGRTKGALNKSTLARMDTSSAIQPIADANRADGWQNFAVGLGKTNKDKTINTTYANFYPLDDNTIAQMYMGDGLSARIINCVADDETREWVELDGSSDDVIKKEMDRLETENKFNEAIRWQRLFGGSLIVIGAMDGQTPNMPLNISKIKNIEYLKVISRTDIPVSECIFDKNPFSPMFGKILVYKVNMYVNDQYTPMMIHHTRTIPFFNDPVPSIIRSSVSPDTRYWGASSLQSVYESIRDLGGINQCTANILYEFVIGKITIERLGEMLAAGQESKLVKRMEIINMTKSSINAVILGENEKYERDYATVAGLPEIIDRFMLQLSGSTGIPVTRLFGRSPAGLNATGENDLRNYYDIIESNQRNRLRNPIMRLIELLSIWKNVNPPEFEFNSLYQMTETEKIAYEKTKAEAEKSKAETENIYVSMQSRSADEVRKEHGWDSEDIPMVEEEEEDE